MHGQEAFEYTNNMPSKSAQGKGWKDIQSKKQTAKKTKWAIIILVGIIGLIIFGKIVKFTQTLFTPWQNSQVNQRNHMWDGDFNINVLIRSKEISLLIFSPHTQKIMLIKIPKNTYLDIAHGFGKWEVRSIYDLGQSQKEYGGNQLLKLTLTDFFALPIEGFLDFSGKMSQKDPSEIITEMRKNPFSIISLLPYIKTDLTPFELIRLKMGLSNVRFDKIKEVDLAASDILQREHLADNSEVFTLDPAKLDPILFDLIDPQIQAEHKTIAIFNSTTHPGLAQKAARLVTNLGGNVIITSNGQNKLKNSQVVGENSKTFDRFRQIFGGNGKIDSISEDLVSSRAQINIFLGEDYID